ncbi:MAG: hypothetical protein LC104_00015 [Bacteroidales bacterium]|jgi:hypothetical protein|nr:hypothetical protein [Bacteroidales bacterium]HNZ59760.1 hypothetical protein [Syntrophorhabdaceae bacterium]
MAYDIKNLHPDRVADFKAKNPAFIDSFVEENYRVWEINGGTKSTAVKATATVKATEETACVPVKPKQMSLF